MSHLGLASLGLQLAHNHAHERGFSFAIPANQRHLLPSLNLNLRIAEHHLLRVPDGKVRPLEHHITGALRRRKLQGKRSVIAFVNLYPLQFFQRLNARLNLVTLGGLVAETVDEIFRLLNHPLLVFVSGGLLGYALCSKRNILAIRNFIVIHMPQQDFHGACGHIVQELAVVRNQKHRAPERLQIVLKPFDGLDVQVVGGLVQEQHVRLREQDFGQFDAHVPALAEGFCEAVQFIGLESQAKEHLFRLRTG